MAGIGSRAGPAQAVTRPSKKPSPQLRGDAARPFLVVGPVWRSACRNGRDTRLVKAPTTGRRRNGAARLQRPSTYRCERLIEAELEGVEYGSGTRPATDSGGGCGRLVEPSDLGRFEPDALVETAPRRCMRPGTDLQTKMAGSRLGANSRVLPRPRSAARSRYCADR
jgi:hypothetical protein